MLGTHPPDFRAGQLQSGVPVLEAVTFGVFAEVQRGRPAASRASGSVWSGYVGLRSVKAENDDAEARARRRRRSSSRSSARWPIARAASSSCSSCAITSTLQHDWPPRSSAPAATPDFRTLTIDKGTRDGIARRHGGDRAGRRRRPRRRAERARGEGAAAHRPQRRGRRADRALARAGRGRRRRRRPAADGVRVGGVRRRRRRRGGDLGHRRHLSRRASSSAASRRSRERPRRTSGSR